MVMNLIKTIQMQNKYENPGNDCCFHKNHQCDFFEIQKNNVMFQKYLT